MPLEVEEEKSPLLQTQEPSQLPIGQEVPSSTGSFDKNPLSQMTPNAGVGGVYDEKGNPRQLSFLQAARVVLPQVGPIISEIAGYVPGPSAIVSGAEAGSEALGVLTDRENAGEHLENMGFALLGMTGVGKFVGKAAKQAKKVTGLQRALDAGPNKWVTTGNKLPADRQRFQRGLSGNYAGSMDGVSESLDLLGGKTDTSGRFVSLFGGSSKYKPGNVTEVSNAYAKPLAIRGRVDESVLQRMDEGMGAVSSLDLKQVEAVGFFTNSVTPFTWAQAYKQVIQRSGIAPSPGSRGERFLRELDDVLKHQKFGDEDPLYKARPILNGEEVEGMLRELYIKWGMK